MRKIRSNAIVGQSGGPTSVINATLAGIIRGCVGNVGKLYGMQNGILGVLEDKVVDLTWLMNNEKAVSGLVDTPGAALGSCRVPLPSDLDAAVYSELFQKLDSYGVKYLFYIGGNDSMDTVAKLNAYSKKMSAGVSIIGVPKTVDNDLILTDHTPGYGSCAKYIATTVAELWADVSSYNVPSVTLLEVMGRDTGWLSCACCLPKYFFGSGCSLVYLPESHFTVDGFLGDLERELRQGLPILVGIGEGVGTGDEESVDSFGHRSLAGIGKALEREIKNQLRCKTRTVELSLPQRCASHISSLTDVLESIEIGKSSVNMALDGLSGKMAAFVRRAGEYGVDITSVDAYLVANKIKYVPKDFINSENNFVTERCVDYLAPLILGEKKVQFKKGIPNYFELR